MSLLRPHRVDLHTLRRAWSEIQMPVATVCSPRPPHRLCSACFLVAVLISLAVCSSSSAQDKELSVLSFTPTSGSEGTSVKVEGEGFSKDLEDHVVFVRDHSSDLGVVFENGTVVPDNDLPDQWHGAVGPAPAPFSGLLTIWKGRRYSLPPRFFEGRAGVYWVDKAQWLIPSAVADGETLFAVESGSSDTQAARTAGNSFILSIPIHKIPGEINLRVVIDGGGAAGPTTTNGGENKVDLNLHLEPMYGHGIDTADVAQDLATVLEGSFGALGLKARAFGTDVHISWSGRPTDVDGFAVLSWR